MLNIKKNVNLVKYLNCSVNYVIIIFPYFSDIERCDVSQHYVEYQSMDEYTTRGSHGNRQKEYSIEQRSTEINSIRTTSLKQIAVKERQGTKRSDGQSRSSNDSRGRSNAQTKGPKPNHEAKQSNKGRSTSLPRERDQLTYENSKYDSSQRKQPKQLALKAKDDTSAGLVNDISKSTTGKKPNASRNRHRSDGDVQSKVSRSKSTDYSYQKSKYVYSSNDYSPISSDESHR